MLIFAQYKSFLDIIERDLLNRHMPSVTYMRLDGTVDTAKRFGIVTKFNEDPSIDLLLLTTHVGGLGLNLTGADIVIFVDHDWNPMKDLQAMDRAHRIGQKKAVNVYRLITRGTLEEKIMSLQKFKLNIANTVINQENASLTTMGTDQLLDLFQVVGDNNEAGKTEPAGTDVAAMAAVADKSLPKAAQAVLNELGQMWDESQYEEYNIENFLSSMKKK